MDTVRHSKGRHSKTDQSIDLVARCKKIRDVEVLILPDKNLLDAEEMTLVELETASEAQVAGLERAEVKSNQVHHQFCC